MGKRKSYRELYGFIRKMPPLYNTLPNEQFDIMKSEVAQWLIKQPDAIQIILSGATASGHIVYDSHTGKWKGVDV
ncbi:MAG: hypothetical protein J1G06_04475 [Oscillospiraceae bacterium]|nr:hypothetical protein [Oscillospiraceae bacterium]